MTNPKPHRAVDHNIVVAAILGLATTFVGQADAAALLLLPLRRCHHFLAAVVDAATICHWDCYC
jgi:hypothetical protein